LVLKFIYFQNLTIRKHKYNSQKTNIVRKQYTSFMVVRSLDQSPRMIAKVYMDILTLRVIESTFNIWSTIRYMVLLSFKYSL